MKLKAHILQAIEHYEKHADAQMKEALSQYSKGNEAEAQRIMDSRNYNKGRAAAMREALELIDEHIG